jgi:hypothetical protein
MSVDFNASAGLLYNVQIVMVILFKVIRIAVASKLVVSGILRCGVSSCTKMETHMVGLVDLYERIHGSVYSG